MPTQLLNDDGTASMATALMSSHHALRRDLACFARALSAPVPTRFDVLREEWTRFHAHLHGHHTAEDTGLFPNLRAEHPELATALDELDAQHRAIDPLLVRGDALFADLARTAPAALELVRALADHLAAHLDAEERVIIPHLRGANAFPLPPTDDVLAMYAEGFAWSSAGISEAVLEPLYAILPPALRERLPAARAAFAAHCTRVWGYVHAGSSLTSVPEVHA